VEKMTEDPFVVHRGLLFTVAYEMLGSATDADDVLQEAWLRWANVDHSQVTDPRAYLIRVVTRQALNQMRALSRRREEYVGEWLPEPLLTSPDVADDVELAESVSIAMLTVLETLEPTERAVFVLREVFDIPYGEIAEAMDKSPAAVRQMAWRAREHVAARRPRVQVSRSEQQAVVKTLSGGLTHRTDTGPDGGHGAGRRADRRRWRARACRSHSDPRRRKRREVARARA
jgi:RNA polymerase sigma factor (sigma-70 family)